MGKKPVRIITLKREKTITGHEILTEESGKNNPDDFCGIPDNKMDELFRESVRLSIETSKIAGRPIAQYDTGKRKAYKLYPDGRRIYE